MNAPLDEWIAKAEGDAASANREWRARKRPNYDSACFHAQQCVEKYLKAALVHRAIHFPKVHDLETLLDLCLAPYPLWEAMRQDLQLLTQYAVQFRYPGENADKEDARKAVAAMKRSCVTIQTALPHFGSKENTP
ncbi:MAG TPA: HEPN domain-containing protein [Kiritimatiellia bacterium]|nr:HEPN domain-containing protein [Kiritimatiellia bacterium]